MHRQFRSCCLYDAADHFAFGEYAYRAHFAQTVSGRIVSRRPTKKPRQSGGLVTNMEKSGVVGWTTMQSCVQIGSEASNFLPKKAPPERG